MENWIVKGLFIVAMTIILTASGFMAALFLGLALAFVYGFFMSFWATMGTIVILATLLSGIMCWLLNKDWDKPKV